jgi:hypothetical protein
MPRRDVGQAARTLADRSYQPQWVTLFAELLRHKRANVQFGYVVHFPWGTKGLDSRDSLRLIAKGGSR